MNRNFDSMKYIISRLKFLYKISYKKLFSKIDVIFEREVGNLQSILDVGCGSNSMVRLLSYNKYCVGVDVHKQSLVDSKSKDIHDEYVECNILRISELFMENAFECVIAIDVIEHLEKEDGIILLDAMERIASRKVIVFTPNGFLPQGDRFSNPWQVHLSGWTVDDFEKRGYNVIGINGHRSLRGEFAKIKHKPKYLFGFISDVSQLLVKNRPRRAFQLFAVRTLK